MAKSFAVANYLSILVTQYRQLIDYLFLQLPFIIKVHSILFVEQGSLHSMSPWPVDEDY